MYIGPTIKAILKRHGINENQLSEVIRDSQWDDDYNIVGTNYKWVNHKANYVLVSVGALDFDNQIIEMMDRLNLVLIGFYSGLDAFLLRRIS